MVTLGGLLGKLFYLIIIALVAVVSIAVSIWFFAIKCPCDSDSTDLIPDDPPEKDALNFYFLNDQYIGYCESERNVIQKDVDYQTIIIMDRSGSMGQQAERLVQNIFPLFFQKLSYKPDNVINMITFDTVSESFNVTVDVFPNLLISARGSTMMAKSVEDCQKVFQNLDSRKPVRLLTISDGLIQDQIETTVAATALNNYLKGLDPSFTINSKAVRLFTSSSQPDTTAISSLLQINNGPSNSLVDLSENEGDDEIAQKIADLFKNDNFDKLRTINSNDPVFKKFPWDDQITSDLKLAPGKNVFWMTELPKDGLLENGVPAKTVIKPKLNADRFEILIRTIFDTIVEEIKVLQIVDSVDSNETIAKIKKYFLSTLSIVPPGQRNISKMPVFIEIDKLVNDQSVKNMSPQEKADYLQRKIILPPL